MGLTFTADPNRKGTLGGLGAGWSVQENATPHVIGEFGGGTGIANFSGASEDESLLLINTEASITHDAYGTQSGVVRTVSQTGLNTSLTMDNKLARFDATATIPPMGAASVPGALALVEQALGSAAPDLGTPSEQNSCGGYWSLSGHSFGVDFSGNAAQASSRILDYMVYDNATATFLSLQKALYENSVSGENFTVIGGKVYAQNVVGDNFVLEQGQGFFSATMFDHTKLIVMAKTMLDGTDFVFSVNGQPEGASADGDYYVPISVTVDPAAETLTVDAEYRSGGFRAPFTSSVSIASLDVTEEMAVRIYISRSANAAFPEYPLVVTASVCNTSDYTVNVGTTLNCSPDLVPIWFDPWTVAGNCRAVWRRGDLVSVSDVSGWPAAEEQDWEPAFTLQYAPAFLTLGPPAIGFTGNVWQYLQDACSAFGWEITLKDDEVYANPIGSKQLVASSNIDISARSGPPTVTPSTTFTGRQVDIVYTNAEVVSNAEVYSALDDDNRILSVGAAETVTTAIQSNAYLTSVVQPSRSTAVIPPAGTYAVIDSTGLPIVADQWEDFGGALSVSLGEQAGVINVTVVGPREQIPSTTAPYSIALSDGQNQYAALSIVGSGVIADPQTLNLLTGANPDKTPQQIAATITNPFIATLAQAYDRGVWASLDASGPRITLGVTVPYAAIYGFGITPGALVEYDKCKYRIASSTLNNIGATLDCVRYTTVEDFDTVWSGETVADHDALWDGYVCENQIILPLKVA